MSNVGKYTIKKGTTASGHECTTRVERLCYCSCQSYSAKMLETEFLSPGGAEEIGSSSRGEY